MRRTFGLAALITILWAASDSLAVTDVKEVGGKSVKIFYIQTGRDSTFGPGSFDFDGDGDRDMERIIAVGYKTTSAIDTLRIHTVSGVMLLKLPVSSVDSWNLRGRSITDIAASSDTTVIRYKNTGLAETPLYVWGE